MAATLLTKLHPAAYPPVLPAYLLQDAFRPPQQPITRRRSGGDARSMKTRRAENNRRAQQRWRDRQKVDHMSL